VRTRQAPHRHPEPDAEDDRPADAARSSGRGRHRDQALMAKGILGRKLGMTQVFDPENGCGHVRHRHPGRPVSSRAGEERRGSTATTPSSSRSTPSPTASSRSPSSATCKKFGVGAYRKLVEFPRLPSTAPSRARLSRRDLRARRRGEGGGHRIGKGFQGTIKRHNFSSGPRGHGSHNVRKAGSIGASATPVARLQEA